MKCLYHCTLLFLFTAPFCVATAQTTRTDTAFQHLTQKAFFSEEQILPLTLRSDFQTLKHKKKKDAFQTATVSFIGSDGQLIIEPVQIAARGEFRREHCDMPSLTINFNVQDSGPLSSLKKLKMVCSCNTRDYQQELLLKEFLVYKIYNLLTDMSFKVRLVKLNYVDTNRKDKADEQYAFFIEDLNALAKRNHCKPYEVKKPTPLITDRAQSTLLYIFQFMIGNLDWSVLNQHNVKLIQARNDSLSAPYAVPYDFDFCGLVNAPYAFPQEEFNVEKVTDRVYRGHPANEAEVAIATQIFTDKKEAIYRLVNGFALLSEAQRKSMIKFLDEFYRTLNNKRDVRDIFINVSRKNR
ncbi:hypothetical protein [Flavisolibacter ginsenosidimutans]|uniref:Uncharacterized protein n=1 Tax=Flavisolibacter ginsenosidimutans TaxID=661481 RepID=A0A5B8UE30_9BACT|nr:hypothetical protein [Flavisolibacter ginsenosidimutans]QEC54768.1 hypothetical protein FSB75_02250 [Flavisolibacter ginsenosidimutans]